MFLGLALAFNFFSANLAEAAAGTLTVLSDTMSRMSTGVNSSHLIKFTTSLAINQTGDTIVITFPSDFNFTGFVKTDVTFTHGATLGTESTETLADAPSATAWGAVPSGTQARILTLTAPTDGVGSAAVAASDKIILTYASTNCTNGSAAAYVVTIAVAGTNTETGQIGLKILASNADQLGVSATVDPTISLAISNASIGFGHFIGTAIRYATADTNGSATEPTSGNPTTLTASTNGVSGLTITVQDQGSGSAAGLYAGAPLSELIVAAASTAVTTGSKKYGIYAKNAASLTIDEGFDNDSNSDLAITRAAQTFATAAAPVSSGTVDLVPISAIDATTKAGAYSDTVTIICTGNY